MNARDLPYNDRVPPKLQYRLPKIKSILRYHRLQNPTVRQRKEDGKLIFKVDLAPENPSPLATVAAGGQISEFLGEDVIVILRGQEEVLKMASSPSL